MTSRTRRASLTAFEVGNTFASLGSINATAVPLDAALKNFPRSSFGKSDILYCGGISNSVVGVLPAGHEVQNFLSIVFVAEQVQWQRIFPMDIGLLQPLVNVAGFHTVGFADI